MKPLSKRDKEVFAQLDLERLEPLHVLDQGRYGKIFVARYGAEPQVAVKINRIHEATQLDPRYTLWHEYHVLDQACGGIRGIPAPLEFFPTAPSLRSDRPGKNVLVRQLVDGVPLHEARLLGPARFFNRLHTVVSDLHALGYGVPHDLNDENVLVGRDDEWPWVIDLMTAFPLSVDSSLREQQEALSWARFKRLERQYMRDKY